MSKGNGQTPRWIIAAAFVAVASLAWFKYAPAPFVGPLLALALLSVLGVRRRTTELGQSLLVTLAAVCVTLAAAEGYWWHRLHSGPPPLIYPENYLAPDGVTGYRPVPNATIRMRSTDGNTLLYDVQYTIDSLGLRRSPPPVEPAPSSCVLFFGDSFTFGEGVEDTASMPYRVAVRTRGRYHVYNFGVHGYGPHQMLALLESNRVRRVLDCEPRLAIYLAITDHVARAAGRRPGGRGPRFVLDSSGTGVVRAPRNIGDETTDLTLGSYLRSQFEKSSLVDVLRSRVGDDDWKLFFAIVRQAQERIHESWPTCDFEVLVWPTEERTTRLRDGLAALGIPVHDLTEIIPDYATNMWAYRIPVDGHPNPTGHDSVAAFVAERLLKDPPRAPATGR